LVWFALRFLQGRTEWLNWWVLFRWHSFCYKTLVFVSSFIHFFPPYLCASPSLLSLSFSSSLARTCGIILVG
jgi:hypothetical protein